MVKVYLKLTDGYEELFDASEAEFSAGFFHARSADSGVLNSWPAHMIGIVSTKEETPPPPPMNVEVISTVPVVAQVSPFARSAMPTQETPQIVAVPDLPPVGTHAIDAIPPGAKQIDPATLRATMRIPMPKGNLEALGIVEVGANELGGVDPLREAARQRRQRALTPLE